MITLTSIDESYIELSGAKSIIIIVIHSNIQWLLKQFHQKFRSFGAYKLVLMFHNTFKGFIIMIDQSNESLTEYQCNQNI